MVAEIAAMARETGGETGRPKFGDAVDGGDGESPAPPLRSFPAGSFAYENRPLPSAKARRSRSLTSSR